MILKSFKSNTSSIVVLGAIKYFFWHQLGIKEGKYKIEMFCAEYWVNDIPGYLFIISVSATLTNGDKLLCCC